MKWFGESWGAPCCESDGRVEAPVGDLCVKCELPIMDGDRGFLIPFVDRQEGEPYVTDEPWHFGCFMESVLGPVFRLGTGWWARGMSSKR